ncbi:GNAT family N-acetyltransferase [Clostridium sp. D2Q-11]|uniref:GNAT family N-acetyltransferase n=1 Tax=Anaeromonas frigoriresistens TaxID=2683708 RepID=A0A942Z799_9FIRM|nr:GNAT family N-acetyltransferase [Anaeromonas frigoriresistens]MBS4538447.1 GNAT family N-acetyltransferase [Anaeromonas frigoriresistens]
MEIREGIVSDIEGITRVHIDSWRSTYKEMLSNDYLQGLSLEKGKKSWRRFFQDKNNKVIVSLNEDKKVIGFASFGPDKDKKYNYEDQLYGIYILEKYQRKGIGRQMIEKVIEKMKNNETSSMIVWVLKDNPSYKFYEYLGGKKIVENDIKIGGRILKKVGYGFDNIDDILNRL